MNELQFLRMLHTRLIFYGNGNSNGIEPENISFCGDCGV